MSEQGTGRRDGMIKIFKTIENSILELDSVEHGCWVNLVKPTETELELISQKTGLDMELLRAPLDEEETSRVEIDDSQVSVIVDIPVMDIENKTVEYYTIPLGIILNDDVIVTVCLRDNKIIDDFIMHKIKTFYTFKKSRFILQILYRINLDFLNV